jgi:hypothetical protein
MMTAPVISRCSVALTVRAGIQRNITRRLKGRRVEKKCRYPREVVLNVAARSGDCEVLGKRETRRG